jgi:hypothetical protein
VNKLWFVKLISVIDILCCGQNRPGLVTWHVGWYAVNCHWAFLCFVLRRCSRGYQLKVKANWCSGVHHCSSYWESVTFSSIENFCCLLESCSECPKGKLKREKELQKNGNSWRTVIQVCSLSYSESWGRRGSWAQEMENSLGHKEKPYTCLPSKEKSGNLTNLFFSPNTYSALSLWKWISNEHVYSYTSGARRAICSDKYLWNKRFKTVFLVMVQMGSWNPSL